MAKLHVVNFSTEALCLASGANLVANNTAEEVNDFLVVLDGVL